MGNQYPPEPQLIAAAIGAFEEQRGYLYERSMPLLKSYTFLGLIMRGVTPIFYKITISEALWLAVVTGTYPLETTIVERLYSVPGKQGLQSLTTRKQVLQCLEAFKELMVSLGMVV